MNSPKITVITVVFNAKDLIERTVLSVINQTYPNIEYIIIDGGSTDGTVELIKQYSDRISLLKSEPDKGIYDAMNKGIDLATGEWINFMNAGDYFYTDDVLEKIFGGGEPNTDFVYGDYIDNFYIGEQVYTKHIPAPEVGSDFWKIYPCHQSCFVRTKFLKDSKFDTENENLKKGADLDKLLEFYYAKKLKFEKKDIIVAYYAGGGYTAGNIFENPDFFEKLKSRLVKFRVIRRYVNTFKVNLYLIYLILRDIVLVALLKPMPSTLRYRLFSFLKKFNLN